MENKTKDKILDAALISFATNGYKGTNLRELASSLNLSKSALYKHYKSKEDIWDALIDKMEEYYESRFGSTDKMPKTPSSCDELIKMTKQVLDFTMHDEKVILTRRLLLVEQFKDERARNLATKHFLSGTKDMYAKIFAEMMKKGILKKDDPNMLAFCYTTPITSLIHLCDREPQREAETEKEIDEFLHHFVKTYGNE